MAIISSKTDREALNLEIVSEYPVGRDRLWQIWEDPRQLEKWWGPPTWPATFETHDFEVGGESHYFMTGPEGEKAGGWWKFTGIEPTTRLTFDDGFSDEDGKPNGDMPTIGITVDLDETDGGTRMTVTSRFATLDELEKVIEMGMEEGMKQAMTQIDALL